MKPTVNDDIKMETFVFGATFIISLAVYLKTASPSIVGGDAGELVAEGCTLGTSHPPGYPLYTILIFVVTQFRLQILRLVELDASPAFFINVMSSLFGSAASALIANSIYTLQKSSINKSISKWNSASCAITTGILHTLSPLAWQYSVTAEVFAMHNFFVAWILYAAIQFAKERSRRSIIKGAFICGLSLTNQHTSMLLVLPIIFWIVFHVLKVQERSRLSSKVLVQSALYFLIGLSPYALLPYAASKYPHAGSWGNVTSLHGFLHHLQRKDYGTFQLYSGKDDDSEGFLERVTLYFLDFAFTQAGLLFCCFFIFGMSQLCRTVRFPHTMQREYCDVIWDTTGIGRTIVASHIFYLGVFHTLANLPLQSRLLFGIHQRFWMHPNVIAFVIGGVGMSQICHHISTIFPSYLSNISKSIRSMIVPGIQLSMLILLFTKNFPVCDQSTNLVFHNYAKSILNSLPKDSLLLINYDQQWTSVRYFQECEHFRKDVTSINLSMMSYEWWQSKHELYPFIHFPGSHYGNHIRHKRKRRGFSFSEFIDVNYDAFEGHIFVGGTLNYPDPRYENDYVEIPHGLVRQVKKKEDSNDMSLQDFYIQSLWAWKIVAKYHVKSLPYSVRYTSETWEWTVEREFYDHLVARVTFLLDMATSLSNESEADSNRKDNSTTLPVFVEAAAWLELAISKDDQSSRSASLRKNLGIAYLHMVRNKESHGLDHPPLLRNVFGKSFVREEKMTPPLWRKNIKWTIDENWKTWASSKWNSSWKDFLSMEGADKDPSYKQVKQIYDQVMASVGAK